MVCNRCGAQCTDDTLFCTSCGNRLAAQQQASQTQNTQPSFQQQPQSNYQPYQQPPVMQTMRLTENEPVTSIGEYLLWWFIGLIPLVGFILTIIFAADSTKKNRANFFRTQLIIIAITYGLIIISVIALVSAGANLLGDVEEIAEILTDIEYYL